MRMLSILPVLGVVFGLMSCASEPVKQTKPLVQKATTNQTAQKYTAWFVQQADLKALSLGEAMRFVGVLEARPCQIVDTYIESSTLNQSELKTDAVYDSKKRLIRTLAKTASTTKTTTHTYTSGRLTSVEFKDASANRQWTVKKTYTYDSQGGLAKETHDIDGEQKYVTTFAYVESARTVNIKTVETKTGKSKSFQVVFDKQWRVQFVSGLTYTYSSDRIGLKSKTREHDIFLKKGRVQSTRRVTNIVVGDTSVYGLASGEMTYQQGQLTQFKQAIHSTRQVADKIHKSDSVHTKKLSYNCPAS